VVGGKTPPQLGFGMRRDFGLGALKTKHNMLLRSIQRTSKKPASKKKRVA
jgi:hypothetical protein